MIKVEKEMEKFITEVYHEPYSLFGKNCFYKSKKIVKKAHELNLAANCVVTPLSITPRHTSPHIPRILPHCFVRIEGEKVDVALDPATEKTWCKNSEIISIAPIDLPAKANPILATVLIYSLLIGLIVLLVKNI